MSSAAPLEPAAAYRLWAPSYDVENAVSALEDHAVRAITPALAGRRLLDAACGTGRRMPRRGTTAVGVDLVFDMIAHADRQRGVFAVADVRALPCAPSHFDVVWCRLALGHIEDLDTAYRELARVAVRGASIIVSDFHAAAARAGHTRSFRTTTGEQHVITHYVHDPEDHARAAAAAGLTLQQRVDATVGRRVRRFYEAAGRLDAYEQQRGLPLVLALALRA